MTKVKGKKEKGKIGRDPIEGTRQKKSMPRPSSNRGDKDFKRRESSIQNGGGDGEKDKKPIEEDQGGR